jgi:hypothetical protein
VIPVTVVAAKASDGIIEIEIDPRTIATAAIARLALNMLLFNIFLISDLMVQVYHTILHATFRGRFLWIIYLILALWATVRLDINS